MDRTTEKTVPASSNQLDLEKIFSVKIIDRRITDAAVEKMIQWNAVKNQCNTSVLSLLHELRIESLLPQHTVVIIASGLYRSKGSTTAKCLITDLHTCCAKLEIQNGTNVNLLERTVLLVLKPNIAVDAKGTLVLSVAFQNQLVVLGKSQHFERCEATKKNGQRCTIAIDSSCSKVCWIHSRVIQGGNANTGRAAYEFQNGNRSALSNISLNPQPHPKISDTKQFNKCQPTFSSNGILMPQRAGGEVDLLKDVLLSKHTSSRKESHRLSSINIGEDCDEDSEDGRHKHAEPIRYALKSNYVAYAEKHDKYSQEPFERFDGSVTVPKPIAYTPLFDENAVVSHGLIVSRQKVDTIRGQIATTAGLHNLVNSTLGIGQVSEKHFLT